MIFQVISVMQNHFVLTDSLRAIYTVLSVSKYQIAMNRLVPTNIRFHNISPNSYASITFLGRHRSSAHSTFNHFAWPSSSLAVRGPDLLHPSLKLSHDTDKPWIIFCFEPRHVSMVTANANCCESGDNCGVFRDDLGLSVSSAAVIVEIKSSFVSQS
jgi:hypothetical protein